MLAGGRLSAPVLQSIQVGGFQSEFDILARLSPHAAWYAYAMLKRPQSVLPVCC